jgi:hypothetical protein
MTKRTQRYSYQVRKIGKPASDNWNEKKASTCAEWADSPEGREVLVLDLLTSEISVLPRGEAQREANEYNRLRK